MSEFSNIAPVAHQFSLVLQTAVEFGQNEGIGIGVIQCAATSAARASTLLMEEHKHRIERGQVRAKNVKTRERAHMFALILALGLARSTLKRQFTTTRTKVQSVMALCTSPAVVELIKYHRICGEHGGPLDDEKSPGEGKTTVAIHCPSLGRRKWGRRQYCGCSESKDDGPPEQEEAGDEEEDGGSDRKGNGAGDGEERRNDSSHPGPMTERESPTIFMMDETALEQPTDTKRAESGSPISRPPKPPNLQALPHILVHRTRADMDLE